MRVPVAAFARALFLALALLGAGDSVPALAQLQPLPDVVPVVPSPLPQNPPPRTGVIPPVSPNPPPVGSVPMAPPPTALPPSRRLGADPQRYDSPICQNPPSTQSADLRAYCRSLGQ